MIFGVSSHSLVLEQRRLRAFIGGTRISLGVQVSGSRDTAYGSMIHRCLGETIPKLCAEALGFDSSRILSVPPVRELNASP
jgi:hypothetical protein